VPLADEFAGTGFRDRLCHGHAHAYLLGVTRGAALQTAECRRDYGALGA
jgi:hypothetical protein